MGYKVKSTGTPWRIIDGPIVKMACDVIFTLTGTDEVSATVYGSGINVEQQTETTLLAAIRMNLKQAIVDKCGQLDDSIVENTVMTNQKTLLQTALTSSGWWFAILLFFLSWFMPINSWAGDLWPYYGTYTNLNAGSGINGGTTISGSALSNAFTNLGTIDNSSYYWVDIWVNAVEGNNDPATGVTIAVYSYPISSGVTDQYVPITQREIDTSTYALYKASTGNSGVTIPLGRFEQQYIGVAAQKTTANDVWSIIVRYTLGRGQSN